MNTFTIGGRKYAARTLAQAKFAHAAWLRRNGNFTDGTKAEHTEEFDYHTGWQRGVEKWKADNTADREPIAICDVPDGALIASAINNYCFFYKNSSTSVVAVCRDLKKTYSREPYELSDPDKRMWYIADPRLPFGKIR